MAKDDKGAEGADPKDKKAMLKSAETIGDQLDDARKLAKQLSGLIDDADANHAQLLKAIQDDAQKQQAERWKIQQDLQTKIFDVMTDMTTNRAHTMDKAYKKFDAYIRG